MIKTLPALFAPLLFDSPCITAERDQTTGDQNETMKVCMLDKFSVKLFNRVVDKYLSPLVDSCDPGFSREEMSQIMVNLIKNHTDYKHLIDDKIFQPQSLVQLMFGKLSSGLRQLAVRKLLISALFQKPLGDCSIISRIFLSFFPFVLFHEFFIFSIFRRTCFNTRSVERRHCSTYATIPISK